MVKIRNFSEEDAEQASNLIKGALIEGNSRNYSQEVINNLCELFSPSYLIDSSKIHAILAAIDKDKVVGIVRLKGNAIFTVFVDPDYHNKGIGTNLIESIENIARNRKYDEVKLGASITAVEFYKKLGYTDTGETYEDEYGLTHIMKKEL